MPLFSRFSVFTSFHKTNLGWEKIFFGVFGLFLTKVSTVKMIRKPENPKICAQKYVVHNRPNRQKDKTERKDNKTQIFVPHSQIDNFLMFIFWLIHLSQETHFFA